MERDGGAGGKRSKKDKGVFSAGRGATVLTETEALEAINYRPRHPESKRAYEEILSLIQGNIGDQPQDILRGAADVRRCESGQRLALGPMRIDVLRRAGAEEARLIVFCTDDRTIDAAALAKSARVSPPGPGPTSSTCRPARSPAKAAIRVQMLGSSRKC